MLNYRKPKSDDELRAIKDYCEKHEIEMPKNAGYVVAAFNEHGVVCGLSCLVVNFQVEPLIGDTPLVAKILLEKVLTMASASTSQVEVVINEDNGGLISQAKEFGFKIVDERMTILRKEI